MGPELGSRKNVLVAERMWDLWRLYASFVIFIQKSGVLISERLFPIISWNDQNPPYTDWFLLKSYLRGAFYVKMLPAYRSIRVGMAQYFHVPTRIHPLPCPPLYLTIFWFRFFYRIFYILYNKLTTFIKQIHIHCKLPVPPWAAWINWFNMLSI